MFMLVFLLYIKQKMTFMNIQMDMYLHPNIPDVNIDVYSHIYICHCSIYLHNLRYLLINLYINLLTYISL